MVDFKEEFEEFEEDESNVWLFTITWYEDDEIMQERLIEEVDDVQWRRELGLRADQILLTDSYPSDIPF